MTPQPYTMVTLVNIQYDIIPRNKQTVSKSLDTLMVTAKAFFDNLTFKCQVWYHASNGRLVCNSRYYQPIPQDLFPINENMSTFSLFQKSSL